MSGLKKLVVSICEKLNVHYKKCIIKNDQFSVDVSYNLLIVFPFFLIWLGKLIIKLVIHP